MKSRRFARDGFGINLPIRHLNEGEIGNVLPEEDSQWQPLPRVSNKTNSISLGESSRLTRLGSAGHR